MRLVPRVLFSHARIQIPLKDFVGLDFTPTMEVEVELDSQAKAVVFRSVRSTLYGNVGRPGEEGAHRVFSKGRDAWQPVASWSGGSVRPSGSRVGSLNEHVLSSSRAHSSFGFALVAPDVLSVETDRKNVFHACALYRCERVSNTNAFVWDGKEGTKPEPAVTRASHLTPHRT